MAGGALALVTPSRRMYLMWARAAPRSPPTILRVAGLDDDAPAAWRNEAGGGAHAGAHAALER